MGLLSLVYAISRSNEISTGLVEALHGGFVCKTDAVIDQGFRRLPAVVPRVGL